MRYSIYENLDMEGQLNQRILFRLLRGWAVLLCLIMGRPAPAQVLGLPEHAAPPFLTSDQQVT